MSLLDKIFHLKAKNASVKNEIIGGLFTFVAMCYILPVNSSILHDMGMNQAGVFAMTAILSFVVTMIMALVTNYPVVLSAGMGLNAYITYTVALGAGYTWVQAMILLTISGIIFFAISLTPVRKWIIDSIPKNLKLIISAALGGFICFVGLRNSGAIVTAATITGAGTIDQGTIVQLGNLVNPAVLIALACSIFCFGLMFAKSPTISNLAIPLAVLIAAIAGVTVSTIAITAKGDTVANYMANNPNMPIAPWLRSDLSWGMSGVDEVLFYGTLKGNTSFGDDLIKVLTTPTSYVAIFSLIFVNIFDTTATLIAVGRGTDMMDEDGNMQRYRSVLIADATGALICAPLGTSTVTSFAESNVGVRLGAKTGLAATTSALLFLLCAFIYPVFSIFTAGSVTAPALICVGAMIFVGNMKDIEWKDPFIAFTAFITVIFALLCYSVASGIGFGLICFCVMKLFAGKRKDVHPVIYIIAVAFIVSFFLTALLPYLSGQSASGIFIGW